LSRQKVVARVPAGDVDDVPAKTELLDVLEEDDLHRLAHVREEGHLARPLDGRRDLDLVPAAGARDAA